MNKMSRKEKWRNVSITQDNVDQYLQDLYDATKGQYINQGVSFNKDDPYQMGLLRLALLEPHAFSGLCKQLLANYFKNKSVVSQEMGIANIPHVHIKRSDEVQHQEKHEDNEPKDQSNQPEEHVNESVVPSTSPATTPPPRKPSRGGRLGGLME